MKGLFRLNVTLLFALLCSSDARCQEIETLNRQVDGYRGIWYMNQPSGDEYVYKYSGGLGTYCAKHRPFAIYSPQANKTFFCFGGATETDNRRLVHMVSEFDHETSSVGRPTLLLDKRTSDAHDNPVISLDSAGHIWIFSTSHGRSRPSFIHRSVRPFDVTEFERIEATRQTEDGSARIDNFSYMQTWYREGDGFLCFFTRYSDPAARTAYFMTSQDGVHWNRWQRLAAIEEGHYQVSGVGESVAGSSLNYHPRGKGLNWRTNVYYLETRDAGRTWQAITGKKLTLPLRESKNEALVFDFESEGLNVYLKDLRYDSEDSPVLLFVTSGGYEAGPDNDPRTWWLAKWNGDEWQRHPVTTSDNNYDMGELWLVSDDDWRVIAPTSTGPQPYNPGGEVEMWQSRDKGESWRLMKRLTEESEFNHTYVRRPRETHPDFFAFWADGHGRQPSESRLYFSDKEGNVYQLPQKMEGERVTLDEMKVTR